MDSPGDLIRQAYGLSVRRELPCFSGGDQRMPTTHRHLPECRQTVRRSLSAPPAKYVGCTRVSCSHAESAGCSNRRKPLLWRSDPKISLCILIACVSDAKSCEVVEGKEFSGRSCGGWSSCKSFCESNPNLIQMQQQVSRILIDTVGPGTFKLILAVSTRKESNSQGSGTSGGQQIPHTVADDN